MDKERIKKHARNPKHIPLIHNYCDRWCERCPYTSRCSVFAMGKEEESAETPESRDIENAAFWEKLLETFQATHELLVETMKERGIDVNIDDAEFQEIQEREDRTHREAENNELAAISRAYADEADAWLESAAGLFEKKNEELDQQLRMALPGADPQENAESIVEAVNVIRWHQLQIHVKLRRALTNVAHGEIEDDEAKDSDGSAKVALIGIDRSINAWSLLWREFPEEEDALLNILVGLQRLRRKVEQAFPNARAFVRPGFDDPTAAAKQ
ncbi:MAG: hypothetical protein NTW86_15650 [Candidatus Sumerlaeota bacterium]|nr:hypothetical protein [Candidatus Sumerlaeota bacterium]